MCSMLKHSLALFWELHCCSWRILERVRHSFEAVVFQVTLSIIVHEVVALLAPEGWVLGTVSVIICDPFSHLALAYVAPSPLLRRLHSRRFNSAEKVQETLLYLTGGSPASGRRRERTHEDAAAQGLRHDGLTEQHSVHLCRPPGDLRLLTAHQAQHALESARTKLMGGAWNVKGGAWDASTARLPCLRSKCADCWWQHMQARGPWPVRQSCPRLVHIASGSASSGLDCACFAQAWPPAGSRLGSQARVT